MKINIEPELLESLYYGNGCTRQEIADIFGCSHGAIWYWMKKYGFQCRSGGCVVTDFTFNDRQREIFEGCIIGDGNLTWRGNNCRFINTDIHEDYLIWLQKQLGVEDISSVKPKYDVDGYAYGCVLTTRVIPSIREEHKRWYPYDARAGTHQNRHPKIIPKDIELTSIKLLFWYIGDGSYSKMDGTTRFHNHLVYDDWLPLSKKICKLLDVYIGITICKQYKDDNGIQKYLLRLNKPATRKFFDMVDSLGFDIPECYLYKFGM